ncbi:ABC transporter substrate-binding protein [Gephyromycinifex aptenodytis]|uniref:ABC transporter substrate-binding protein n=1 Tax=Gephyromycinifex aptenodytis TaxID=2716227 RepID=UPI001447A4B8|nr:ABC transporter substrate-binding protein [Gephyromycinifex aptenodytis]
MFRSRSVAAIAASSFLVLGLSACAESQREEGGGGSGSGGGTFTFGAAGAPKVFDPFYATDGETFRVSRQMMQGLVGFKDGTADPEPGLATEWTPSEDGLTWTFKLREDVKFHDGTDFNADAVCKNFERMYNQTGAGATAAVSQYWFDNFGGFKDGKEPSLYKFCTVKDPTTVELGLTRVTSKFPALLGLPSFSMQSPTAMEKYNANTVTAQGEGFVFPEYAMEHPVGTGPMQFGSYDQANKTITLKKFDDYWGEKAKIDKLVFKIIPDESARRQELQAGSIQGYDFPNPVDWQALKGAGAEVKVRPAFNILYLGMNSTTMPELKDLKVRQALMHAINREQIVKTQLPEGATAASQFVPDTVAGYNKDLKVPAYDPAKAKQMLTEAGAAGMTVNFWYPSEVTRPYMPAPQKIYEAIRTDLEAVGLKVKPTVKPWNGGYLDQVDAGQAGLFLLGWTGDYNTADNFIGTFFGDTENRFKTSNYPWGQPLKDALQDADSTVDEGERTGKYEKLNEQIMTEYLPAIPISHSPPAIVLAKGVSGVTPSPLTDETFDQVELGG